MSQAERTEAAIARANNSYSDGGAWYGPDVLREHARDLARKIDAVLAAMADGNAWCPICEKWTPHEQADDEEYPQITCSVCYEPDGDQRAADAIRAILEADP